MKRPLLCMTNSHILIKKKLKKNIILADKQIKKIPTLGIK